MIAVAIFLGVTIGGCYICSQMKNHFNFIEQNEIEMAHNFPVKNYHNGFV
jgi:hypothetical protein